MRMRGITLWQPFAQAIFTANPIRDGWVKEDETRSWALPDSIVGEWTFIHAARRVLSRSEVARAVEDEAARLWGPWRATLNFGDIIGKVRFGPCRPTLEGAPQYHNRLFGDWSAGRWAWPIVEREKFETPVPAKGAQGWWFADV